MSKLEGISLHDLLMAMQNPARRYSVFLGRERVIGFEVEENPTYYGRTYTGTVLIVTLCTNPYRNERRTLAFNNQDIKAIGDDFAFKWVTDVYGVKHAICLCVSEEVTNSELNKIIKGN